MEQVKPRLLLVVPMLHQGGFERVCVRTARILRNDFEVTIAMFSDADIAYDINGLSVVNLDVPAQDGKLKKMVNVVKRTVKLRKLKKKLPSREVLKYINFLLPILIILGIAFYRYKRNLRKREDRSHPGYID